MRSMGTLRSCSQSARGLGSRALAMLLSCVASGSLVPTHGAVVPHRFHSSTNVHNIPPSASGERLHGVGLAILHHPPASVALRPSQNHRSRNRAPEIWILNALW